MVLTEADAGSDLGAVATRATLDEATGQWHLNGVKRFITNGLADVFARPRPERGRLQRTPAGLSMFLVERDDTVKIRRIENKMGIHSSPTCEIQYNNTPAILLGKRRFGLMRYSMNLMNGARLAVAAQAMGIAEAAYREADRYSRERIQFGKPIRALPAVGRILLSMKVDLAATRALLAETARWVDLWKVYEKSVGEGGTEADPAARARLKQCQALAETMTPMVKYCSTEMGNRVCYQAMQIHGGVGYMKEFNIERLFRDVRITNIYEGTSQLQVVAAIGKLLNRSLDPLLAEWSAAEYPADMAAEKATLVELTATFQKAVDALKAQPERDRVDYYACDLVDTAVWLDLRLAAAARHQRPGHEEANRPRLSGVGRAADSRHGRDRGCVQCGSAGGDRGLAGVGSSSASSEAAGRKSGGFLFGVATWRGARAGRMARGTRGPGGAGRRGARRVARAGARAGRVARSPPAGFVGSDGTVATVPATVRARARRGLRRPPISPVYVWWRCKRAITPLGSRLTGG